MLYWTGTVNYKGEKMNDEKDKCPCAAVAELKLLVEMLTKKVDENERRIDASEKKLNSDFTELKLITKDIQTMADDIKDIHSQFKEFLNKTQTQKSEEHKNTMDRVHKIVDEVIRWGILLLLGFVATKIGLQ